MESPIVNKRNFIGAREETINAVPFEKWEAKQALDPHNLPIVQFPEDAQKPLFEETGLTSMNLGQIIQLLPQYLPCDDVKPLAMMREWTSHLPLRFQGVILTAIRGCDSSAKHDPSKRLMTMIRRSCCNPADPRETLYKKGFMGLDKQFLAASLNEFFGSMDQYPFHFIMHLTHACEVIGYCMPNTIVACFFQLVYAEMCMRMHLTRETKLMLYARLTEDRVAKGTVEL